MKAKSLLLTSAFSAAVLLSSPATAADHQVPSFYTYLGAHVTGQHFDKNKNKTRYEELALPGIQGGHRFNKYFSGQVSWERAEAKLHVSGRPSRYVGNLLASGRFHFHDNGVIGLEPYAGLAAGEIRYGGSGSSADRQFIIGPEFGVQRGLLNQNLVLDFGFRPLFTDYNDQIHTQIYAGVNLAFGVKNSEPVEEEPEALDSDGDGVPDDIDECPDTPSGVAVDEVGCPLDSDGDGVPDYLDKCPDTPEGALVDDEGCQKVLEKDISETLYLEFEISKADLTEQGINDLGKIADLAQQYSDAEIVLEGHTDSTGSVAFNEQLSTDRAEAVKNALADHHGVSEDRMETVGYGPHEPIADNSTAEGRQENRRVEVILRATTEEAQYKD